MLVKKPQNLIAQLFITIIFLVPIYWIFAPEYVPTKSLIEGRTLKDFPSLSLSEFRTSIKLMISGNLEESKNNFWGQFITNQYQDKIEKASSDQFPFRMEAIKFSKAVDRTIISLAYIFLADEAIPSDMSSGLLIMRDESMLVSKISKFSSSRQQSIDARIENYKILIDNFPNINFSLFYHERLINSPYHPMKQFVWNADNRQAFQYFIENKPEELPVGTFLLTSLSDHASYYFHTDHHWNIHGALKAYDEIYILLRENYPDISPPLKHEKFISFPGIEFLGSSARATYYPIRPDKFEVADIDLPDYTVEIIGKDERYNLSADYHRGIYSMAPYTNHYGNYYGVQQALLRYKFKNNSTRDLLIIGSSFIRPLQPLIASHYKTTYVVDLRQYEDFSLKSFISNYPIDDLLIIGDNIVAFQDIDWKINP